MPQAGGGCGGVLFCFFLLSTIKMGHAFPSGLDFWVIFFLFFFLLVGLFLNRNRLFSPPSPASKEFVFALSQHLTGFQSTPNNLVALPSRTEEGREQVSHAEIQVYVAISTHTHTYREDEAV